MRKIRTAAITMTAVGLLAGSAVVAQDEEPAPIATAFTGAFTSQIDMISDGTNDEADGLETTTEFAMRTSMVASDPRLTGSVVYTGNWLIDTRGGMSDDHVMNMLRAATYEVTNDGGSWLGEATAFSSAELGVNDEIVVFTGRGGYDGLTAVASVNHVPWPAEFEGTIFPSAMLGIPEPYVEEQQ